MNTAADQAFAMPGVVLPLTEDCPVAYADIVQRRQTRGLSVDPMASLIGSICRVHDAAIATRNARHFSNIGLQVIDPWES